MTELINAGSRDKVKTGGMVLPWQLYFVLILSGFAPCHLCGYYYFFYWRSKKFRTVHLNQNCDMQKNERRVNVKNPIILGVKSQNFISKVSRTYDDFLPLASVADKTRKAKKPQEAQELERDDTCSQKHILF